MPRPPRSLSQLSDLPLTYPAGYPDDYPEGAASTRADFPIGSPAGYRVLERSLVLGFGSEVFERASHGLLSWQMHLQAGINVDADTPTATTGSCVLLTIGRRPLVVTAPCRVVGEVNEPDRRGFAYGTLPGHPESGEESFIVSRSGRSRSGTGPDERADNNWADNNWADNDWADNEEGEQQDEDEDEPVTFTVRAFSRPASTLARIGGPFTRLVQARMTERYLHALRSIALDG
jgi:uncharacterized protein (UPF0548 family)